MSTVTHRPLGTRIRRAFRELMGSTPPARANSHFHGAEFSALNADWITSCIPADEEVRGSLSTLRGRARDHARNNAYASSFLEQLSDNIIGPHGMTLEAQTREPNGELAVGVNKVIEDAWQRYVESPVTRDGRMLLPDYEQLALKTVATDGETFARRFLDPEHPFGISLELIDADQIDESHNREGSRNESEIRMGIEVDSRGRRTRYYVAKNPRRPHGVLENRDPIPADQINHLFRAVRPNQTRGLTWFTRAMWPLKLLDGFEESVAVAARAGAAQMALIIPNEDSPGSEPEGEPQADPRQPQTMEASPGTMWRLNPGDTVEAFKPEQPTGHIPSFIKTVLRKIASAWNHNYNSLSNDLEGVNYTSLRHGMIIQHDHYRVLQLWWARSFRQWLFENWLHTSLLTGQLQLPTANWRDYRRALWIPKGRDWVDPRRDIEAEVIGIQSGLTTRDEVLRKRGKQFDKVIEQLAREEKMAAEAGIKLGGGIVIIGPDAGPPDDPPAKDESEEKPSKNGRTSNSRLIGV